AAEAGVPAAEAALLTAWATNAGLADAPEPAIPAPAFGLLITSLEALLRIDAFDAFGALAPLAERILGVPARDRHEHLAQMYLRRGFVDSAAEEWARACDLNGPDAAALTGLARVAAAHGNATDAREFAEAAVELDPSHADAAGILRALAVAA
ncbi:MAG TPA: hypothetical protein VN238_14285, partial [Solirubrobacteraceae bacterium]|nr:hypothetical protein [Solirubrobacteraceae bacterium]